MQDRDWMLRAIALGEKGRLTAPPNPWVGCVLVKEGKLLGEGFHRAPGQPHAEVEALQAAGEGARGAVAYITLEPCSHHGRTPPCAEALIAAGIKRVVVALEDPDPKVNGQGLHLLRDAGIEVLSGVCATEAVRSLRPYLVHRQKKRPFCVLKIAASIDGKTAAKDRSSQWITSEEARRDAHLLRAESQAVLIGSGTAIADSPRLTVRGIEAAPQPLRVLLDTKGAVPASGPLFDPSLAPTLVFTSADAAANKREAWEKCGAEVMLVERSDNGMNLAQVMEELGRRDVLQLLVEGGATILGSFLRQGLADRLVVYTGPSLLGEEGWPMFRGIQVDSIQKALPFEITDTKLLGNSLRVDYLPLQSA